MSSPRASRPRASSAGPGDTASGRGLLRVGRFFGVPLYFAPSWLLIAAVITFSYGDLVRDLVPDITGTTATLVALGYAVALALCVLAHELGHVAVSLALHRPVRRVVIFLLGGVSEIEGDLPRARDEMLVSAAGPAVSLIIGGAAAGGAYLLEGGTIGWVLLALLAWSNLVVAVFNLLPGLPLDGGRILRGVVWGLSRSRLRGTVVAAWAGRVVAVLVLFAAVLINRGTWSVGNTAIGAALAVFIWIGASQSLKVAEVEGRLPQLRLASLLRPGLMVPWDISVAEALRRAWGSGARGLVVVDSAGRARGIVEESRVTAVPPDRQAWTSIGDLARPLTDGLVLPVDLAGQELLDRMQRMPAPEYLVVHPDGTPAGILAGADVVAVLAGTPTRVTGAAPAGAAR